jgi:hypothetical protein
MSDTSTIIAAQDDINVTDPFDLPVHPMAARDPMMPEDELAGLVNGLLHPIMLGEWIEDDETITFCVIDGRNRLRACQIAGVEPRFERFYGLDVRSFIVSVNLEWRNLTAGQRAMLYAVTYPEPGKGGRGHKRVDNTSALFSDKRLQLARTVLRGAPDLVDAVIAGSPALDAAFKTAQERKTAAQSEEAKLAQLRTAYPDIAEMVAEGRIILSAGLTEQRERDERTRIVCATGRRAAAKLADFCSEAALEAGEPIILNREAIDHITTTIELLRQRLEEQDASQWLGLNGPAAIPHSEP